MAGLADAEGHLTKTYQYSVTGELTYGSAVYENEYTYNGESYNPNIHSQYLRARYYNVVTANFITEDSCLGRIQEPLTLNRYNYCISSYLNYWDPSGFEITMWDMVINYALNYDAAGFEIGMHYLYGGGEDFIRQGYDIIRADASGSLTWSNYMKANAILTGKVGDVVIPIGERLNYGDSIDVDMTIKMIIENGEGATGYEFMHGTSENVGGFQILGTISRNKEGDITYDLEYTWNDVMDPFPEAYSSDAQKAELAKKIPFSDPKDFIFRVSWHDKTVIYQSEKWFKRNKGWLKNWNADWVDSLDEKTKKAYRDIDIEQIVKFNSLSWKDYLELVKEVYFEYYKCGESKESHSEDMYNNVVSDNGGHRAD